VSMANRKPYPSDVSDEEWSFVAPYLALIREDAPQREHDLREVFNGLRWIVRTGSQWRYMPHDLPPWEAVYQQTRRWLKAGVFEAMVHDLRVILRLSEGRTPVPTGRPYSTRAPYSPHPRAATGAAGTGTNAGRAPKYTLPWTRSDTYSPCSSARPRSRSGLGWASWPRRSKRRPANRWS